MHKLALPLASLVFATTAQADRLSEQCRALYDEITADVPLDLEQCTPVLPAYDLVTCEAPVDFDVKRPASHLILAIDSSGSMAASIGGETKMAIAQREALAFLQNLDENISVGLVVYGHLGNNQQDGKAESCTSSELIHDFDTSRDALAETIASLTPTGWTPMGGVLGYSAGIIADLPEPDGETILAPVIYMISDGEETCDGDPAAQAAALYGTGVRTTVNTIGFAVDAETRAQLEAIAEAGGGTFYPAENGSALRDQLQAILDAELSLIQYGNCVQSNSNEIYFAFSPVSSASVRCFNENDPAGLLRAVMAAQRDAGTDDPLFQDCGNQMVFQASDDGAEHRNFVADVVYPFDRIGRTRQNEYLIESGFPPIHPTD